MVIGIGGASRSAKSRLAIKLKDQFVNKKVHIIEQDEFVIEEKFIPKINDVTDWEHPASIDFKKLKEAIKKSITQFEITIVEGFLVYYDKEVSELIDFKIFLSIDESTFLKRKVEDKRWGKTSVFYVNHIWQSYLKYGKVKREQMNLFIDSNSEDLPEIASSTFLSDHL